jgi:hypothetical protein
MKTLVSNSVSLYLLDDAERVEITAENTVVGSPTKYVISDLNESNATVVLDVTPPEHWVGGKYRISNGVWSPNPGWKNVAASKEEQEANRRAAYEAEADPLFFMSQRGEATVEEWQAKVAEIKARYPYPEETQA